MSDKATPTADDIATASAILSAARDLASKVALVKIGAHVTGHKDAVEGRENSPEDLIIEWVTDAAETKCEFCGDPVQDQGDAWWCVSCEQIVFGARAPDRDADIARAADIMLSRPDVDDPWDAYVAAVAQCRCGETGCVMATRPDATSPNCPQCSNPIAVRCCNYFIDAQSVVDFKTEIADHNHRMTRTLTAADHTALTETAGLSL